MHFAPYAKIKQHFFLSAQLRSMSTQERKHLKLRTVDNIGVIVLDSPGVKVKNIIYHYRLNRVDFDSHRN